MPRWEPNAPLRLVEAALELFEEQGYDDTSVAQIAERAGLTKTTFFRHFPDKREVLAAGQETHSQLLADGIAAAPADLAPLALVGAGLDTLAASMDPERRGFGLRLRHVIAASSELSERDALKRAGYTNAMAEALRLRGVPEPTATVAADLGALAFKLAYAEWTESQAPRSLAELTQDKLREISTAGASLAAN